MVEERRRRCCWEICDAENGVFSACCLPAEYEITNTSPGADPNDVTDACEGHVGYLLGSVTGAIPLSWRVEVIDPPEDARPLKERVR